MCFILLVNHIPCTHTISIWQHCIAATRSSIYDLQPCWDVRQHGQAIFTRKLCEDCGGDRFFARRGGVAERGNGSPPATPVESGKNNEDDADDSGYHSEVIHEEEEGSDIDDLPLSPRAMAPPRMRTKQRSDRKRRPSNQRPSLNCKPSWKPNLKRELTVEGVSATERTRRDSIDSLISNFDRSNRYTSGEQQDTMERKADITATTREPRATAPTLNIGKPDQPKGRLPARLHPSSSSPVQIALSAQTAKAFPYAQQVEVPKPPAKRANTYPKRKKSTLLHPSSSIVGFAVETQADTPDAPPEVKLERPRLGARKGSSLLHPSAPSADLSTLAQYKTVISVPPKQQGASPERRKPSTLLHPSPPSLPLRRRPAIPARRVPPLVKAASDSVFSSTHVLTPQTAAFPRKRRESILHSCLSDAEDEGFDEPRFMRSRLDLASNIANAREGEIGGADTVSFEDDDADEAEGAILANSAMVARASRRRLQHG